MTDTHTLYRSPLSPLPLSLSNCPNSNPRKRKYVEEKACDAALQPFQATQLSPPDRKGQTATLVPVFLVARTQLRLSHINYSTFESSLSSGSQCYATIPIFDHAPGLEAPLLLARVLPNGGLCLVERLTDGKYIFCMLRDDVKESSFQAMELDGVSRKDAGKACEQYNKECLPYAPTAGNETAEVWTARASSPKRPKNRRGTLARMSIFPSQHGLPPIEQAGITEQADPSPALQNSPGHLAAGILDCDLGSNDSPFVQPPEETPETPETPAGDPSIPSATPEKDPLEMVHEVLLKVLYNPKVALTHFTKSTLSRIRASVRSSTSTLTNIAALADLYRSRLTATKKMDLKYRETVTGIVDKVVQRAISGDLSPCAPLSGSKKKTRGNKKVGKNGLYADEEDYITSAWLDRDETRNGPMVDSEGQTVQEFLKELRNRETQLQIILILEVLALEHDSESGAKRVPTTVPEPALVKSEPEGADQSHDLASIPVIQKKKRDLKPALDVLVDRLCIYQSVNFLDHSATEEARDRNGAAGLEATDKLRDFCCNVILPFYLHKVPATVKEISVKLGGPDVLPKRPSLSKSRSKSETKPGAAVGPRQRPLPQKTLERVLKEERGSRKSSPPGLTRSASTPMGSMSARASAEPSLSRPSSRGNLHRSLSLSNREVDLVAQYKADESKRKKLADLAKRKEDLDTAIHALKKPNRNMMSMEIMADAEKRKSSQDDRKRAILRRSKSDACLGVQITATPKKRTGLGRDRGQQDLPAMNHNLGIPDFAAQAGELTIPSSTSRGIYHLPRQTSNESPAVHETPSRGESKTSNPLNLSFSSHASELASSPVPHIRLPPMQNLDVESTPSQKRPARGSDRSILTQIDNTPLKMKKSNKPVLLTAVTGVEVGIEKVFKTAPVVSRNAVKSMDRLMNTSGTGGMQAGAGVVEDAGGASIYESLGWDDDVDELL